MSTETILLTIIVAPEIEDALVDWLLERDDVPGFSSSRISGHGDSPKSFTVAEQVAGRRPRVMLQSCMDSATLDSVVSGLREAFAGSGMRYWAVPLSHFGRLD